MTIERVYFDNAATTPLNSEVVAAMLDVMQNTNGNPKSRRNFANQINARGVLFVRTMRKI